MAHTFTDYSQRVVCPRCQSTHLQYQVRPNVRMEFKEGAAECTHYFGDLRDYKCENCETEFLIAVEDCHET